MIGIYKFENLLNGHCYIGQSINIERRYREHINRAENLAKTESHSVLHRALKKYGISNFSFTILEECSKEQLNEREQYWIAYYDSFANGYNSTSGGDAQEASMYFTKEIVDEIKQLLLNTDISYQQIHQQYNISIGRISEINTGKIWFDQNLSYPLRTLKRPVYCKNCGVEISHRSTLCTACANLQKRCVSRPTREELKDLIRSKPFTTIGRLYKVSDNAIKKWCDSYNLPRTKKEIKTYSDTEWENI